MQRYLIIVPRRRRTNSFDRQAKGQVKDCVFLQSNFESRADLRYFVECPDAPMSELV